VEIRQYNARWKSSSFPKGTSPVLPNFFWQSYQLLGTEKKLLDNKKCTFKKFFGFGIPGWVVGDNGKWQQKSIDFDTSSVANKH